MKRIERTAYLNKLIAFKDKNIIKVITGIRRCGKSTIMEIFRDWLLGNGVKDNQIIASQSSQSVCLHKAAYPARPHDVYIL